MTTPPSQSIPPIDDRLIRIRASKKKYRDTHQDTLKEYRSRTKDAAASRSQKFLAKNGEKQKAYWKEYAQKHRERIRDRVRIKRFNVSPEQWAELFSQQGESCAICRATEPGGKLGWHGDHDHQTGRFRGILCRICNVMLGHAKDDVDIFRSAIQYLIDPPYKS